MKFIATPKSKPNPEEYFKRAAFLHHQTESAKGISIFTYNCYLKSISILISDSKLYSTNRCQ